MNQPLWQPNADLKAAIAKATSGFRPPIGVAFDLSRIHKAIDEMAARQRRMFDEIDRRIKEAMPANLRDVRGKPALEDIVHKEGIPIAHVPRGAIVQELVDCPDHEARRKVLAARVNDIVEDCLAVLDDALDDPADDAIRQVAIKAARALGGGHAEAAQALAVLASEQFISDNIGDYGAAVRQVNSAMSEDSRWFVSYYNAYLPLFFVPTLYTSWRPTDGTPIPNALSRHVTVHQVTADHLNLVNAVISVLQVSGLAAAARWTQEFTKRNSRPQST
ncbi:hypothetical protein ACQI5H_23860 [Mycobacterium heidelbergense]|uniref:hypothetical protein n=1 Tax=Mycobacterium heidelbergense TaxID=53376 RepID=UPI003CEF80D3